MELASEKPLVFLDQVYAMWRKTALPEIMEAIDQQQLLTKIAHEKRMAIANTAAHKAAENTTDVILTPWENLPQKDDDNRGMKTRGDIDNQVATSALW